MACIAQLVVHRTFKDTKSYLQAFKPLLFYIRCTSLLFSKNETSLFDFVFIFRWSDITHSYC